MVASKVSACFGVDAVRLRVEQAPGKPPKVHDLSVILGTDLAHPLGSPANWVREGSRAELAVLLKRLTPSPHPILAIQDDSPFFFGNWALSAFIPVAPSNQVTLEWQTAHSIDGSGAGQAEYSRLKRFVNYLTQCTAQFLDAAGLRVRFDIPDDMPSTALAGKARHCLFLAVREALNNAVRHARADLIRLEIRAEKSSLRIVVEDNGFGFLPEQAGALGTHEGLANMRRRMEDIGGTFEITSRPSGGTRVEFIAPLPEESPTPTRNFP